MRGRVGLPHEVRILPAEAQPDARGLLLHDALVRMDTGLQSQADACDEAVHPLRHAAETVGHRVPDAGFQVVKHLILSGVHVQEKIGQGRRGFHVPVRHQVRDMEITVVADGRNDRHRARGDGDREVEIVEARKVQFRSAATQNQQGVIPSLLRIGKRGNDGRRGLFALHQRFV